MIHQHSRTNANLHLLKFVARKLGELRNKLVFLGGCAIALLIDDLAVPDIRITLDVDCIVDVLSLVDYYKLEKKLEKQGFRKSINDDVICRWHYENVILDVMPTDENILGFGNRWYKSAIKQACTILLADNLPIKLITAPYFIATKLEAFNTRGKHDYLTSHDFEDIISLIDGRTNLINEIKVTSHSLQSYIAQEFTNLLKDDYFPAYLPGHLNYGTATSARTAIVLARIKQLANLESAK
jgi:hypothetical protein